MGRTGERQGQEDDRARAAGGRGGALRSGRAPRDTGTWGWPPAVVLAAVLTLVALALRLRWLDQPVRYDEAVTFLSYVSRPLGDALSSYDLPNNHLFHTLLARLSVEAFGDAPWALRLPAFVAGVATVPATYLLARDLHDRATGALAASLVAASPALVLFSTNARGYGLVVLAFVVLARLAVKLRRRRTVGAWAAFVAVAALGAWTIPIMLYPVAAVLAWLVVSGWTGGARPPGRLAAEGTAAGVVILGAAALLYLPVLRSAGPPALVDNRFVAPRPVAEYLSGVPGFLAGVWGEWTHGLPAGAGAVLGAAAAVGVWPWLCRAVRFAGDGGRRGPPARPPGDRLPLFPVALAAALVVMTANRRTPFPRVWLFLLPAFAVLAARGAWAAAAGLPGRRWRRGAVVALALATAGAGGLHMAAADPVSGWTVTGVLPSGDRVAELLARRWDEGDAVAARIPSDAPLAYYFRREGIPRRALRGLADPGGCLYAVVNLRHGQTLERVAPARALAGGAQARRIAAFPGVEVYAFPPPGSPSACGPAEDRDAAGPHPAPTSPARLSAGPAAAAARRRRRVWRSPYDADRFGSDP